MFKIVSEHKITKKQDGIDNIVFRWRFLWREITTWLGAYLVAKSLNADEEFLNQIIAKLNRVITDFGNLMRMFFGDQAADGYIRLFKEYITLFIQLIDALVEGNTDIANQIVEELYESVGERAEYLSRVNPYWDRVTLENYIYNFTEMTIQEINMFLDNKYSESISIYDRILSYSTGLSDFLAEGLKKYLLYTL